MARVSVRAIANGKMQQDTFHYGSIGNYGFIGVYDGHGGTKVSRACADTMHRYIKQYLMERCEFPHEVLTQAFYQANLDALVATPRQGSTASVFMWSSTTGRLSYANVGDSWIVLSRQGKAVTITEDHNGRNKSEQQRVLHEGGELRGGRINGQLSVTRTIGDRDYKPFATETPFIGSDDLLPTDEFAIIASDGLWDTVTPQQAVDEAAKYRDAEDMVDKLIELAVKRKSRDNITVGIVLFRPLQPDAGDWSFEQQLHLHEQANHPVRM